MGLLGWGPLHSAKWIGTHAVQPAGGSIPSPTLLGVSMDDDVVCSDALAWLRSLPDNYATLCVTSPPYTDARTYGVDADRKSAEWVEWIRPICVEACRVCRLVAINCCDCVRGCKYQMADLWLMADLTRLDGLALGPAPFAWVKAENEPDSMPNGQPGSGGPYYQRRDWEPIYLIARPENLPPAWTNNTAFGHAPRWAPGGATSHRNADGKRANQYLGRGKRGDAVGTTKGADGNPVFEDAYAPPAISNPGNVIRAPVGGGRMGHPLAHESEAPMSLGVAEKFVCWYCPPGGLVVDMFCGSGTTFHAAKKHGRRYAGCDLRLSQVDLTLRRLSTVAKELFA